VTENRLLIVHVRGDVPNVEPRAWDDLLGPGSPSVRARPTLGFNGALYLSTDRGIFALSPYPDLRVLWRSGSQGAQLGQAALSPDEATAYVVDGGAGQLVALDSADGTARWRSGSFDRAAPGAAAPLPVPVVTSLAVAGRVDRLPLVYVVSGHRRGKALQVFEGDGGKSASLTTTGFFSRPVVDDSGAATLVRKDEPGKGRLCSYRWRPGEAAMQEQCQETDADDLSALSVLAADGDNRVYVIDGTSSPQKVRGYTPARTRLFALDVPETASASDGTTNFGDNLLVAADGTLYAANRNALFAIEPRRLASPRPDLVVAGADVAGINRTAFLAEASITLAGDVAVGPLQSVVLRAGSTIAFTPGFSVSKGAQVLCQTGAAQP
jgi:outer membrane protein assembly factor BamB